MAKKSDKARGICYKVFSHVTRTSLHPYIDPSTINDNTQAVWTIQCVLNLVSFAVPHLASAGDGHKLTAVNQKIVSKQLNEKIIAGGKKKPSSVQNLLNDVCCFSTLLRDSELLSTYSNLVLASLGLPDTRFFGEQGIWHHVHTGFWV